MASFIKTFLKNVRSSHTHTHTQNQTEKVQFSHRNQGKSAISSLANLSQSEKVLAPEVRECYLGKPHCLSENVYMQPPSKFFPSPNPLSFDMGLNNTSILICKVCHHSYLWYTFNFYDIIIFIHHTNHGNILHQI